MRFYDSAMKAADPFSAVLMDMTLPGGMNGEETFLELRKIDPLVRVIASSGFFDEGAAATFKELGFVNILPKPYPASELSRVIYESIRAPVG